MALTPVKGRSAPYGNYVCHTFQGGRLLWLAWKYAAACVFMVRHACASTCIVNACDVHWHMLYWMHKRLNKALQLCCLSYFGIFLLYRGPGFCPLQCLLRFWTELAYSSHQHDEGWRGVGVFSGKCFSVPTWFLFPSFCLVCPTWSLGAWLYIVLVVYISMPACCLRSPGTAP